MPWSGLGAELWSDPVGGAGAWVAPCPGGDGGNGSPDGAVPVAVLVGSGAGVAGAWGSSGLERVGAGVGCHGVHGVRDVDGVWGVVGVDGGVDGGAGAGGAVVEGVSDGAGGGSMSTVGPAEGACEGA